MNKFVVTDLTTVKIVPETSGFTNVGISIVGQITDDEEGRSFVEALENKYNYFFVRIVEERDPSLSSDLSLNIHAKLTGF